MSQAEIIKSLKVKTGALKRVQKELAMYVKERDKEQAKVEKMKADGAEAHDLKQAENVFNEAQMMVPETQQRLEGAFSDLKAFVGENSPDIPEDSEELAAAKEILALVEALT